MSYLVLGGTGTVGSAVVRTLLGRRAEVRVVTRSAEKAASLPAGATAVLGDLQDPATFPRVFDGAERIFLLNGVVPTELQEGLAAVNEARRVRASRVVYLSVHNTDQAPHVPHLASKVAIERALAASGVPFTILRPNNFYQNDYWFREAILQYGVYPQPLGRAGVSRVDVRDIADAAVNALTGTGHEGKTYALAGPDSWTGEGTAAAYADALGRVVRYAGDDLVEWSRQALQMLPAWMVYDFQLMYAHFQAHGLRATPRDLEETRTIVGRAPRGFGEFVRETVAQWTAG